MNLNIFHLLKSRIRRENFLTTPLSILISPIYFLKRGLYKEISRVGSKLEGDILDVVCGSKPYQTYFLNAKTYYGVDTKISGHNHKDSKADVFYDGKKLPFSDNFFDSVVSTEVLEHVFNIENLLSEISRVLKKDGLFMCTVPFAYGEHDVPYDFARYTSFGIRYLLKKNFKIIELVKTTSTIIAIGQLLINYIDNHLLSSWSPFRWISRLLIIFPLNLLFIFFDFIFPKKYTLYCNLVVVSKNLKA